MPSSLIISYGVSAVLEINEHLYRLYWYKMPYLCKPDSFIETKKKQEQRIFFLYTKRVLPVAHGTGVGPAIDVSHCCIYNIIIHV